MAMSRGMGDGESRPSAPPCLFLKRRGRSVLIASALIVAVLPAVLIAGGCGRKGVSHDLRELLEKRARALGTLRYTCITEDGERLYREEFELSFPDRYRYRLYENADESPRLVNAAEQRGDMFFRARASYGDSGSLESLESETATGVPPLRNGGKYLGLYHLAGNADYFYSVLSLLDGGSLVPAGKEDLDGAAAWRLDSAAGLTPRMSIWLDTTTGLPLRKELYLDAGKKVVFRFQGYEEGFPYPEQPFPPDVKTLFEKDGAPAKAANTDEGSAKIDLADAASALGFVPLVPVLEGFQPAGAWWRDPSSHVSGADGQPIRFPAGFRELYLIYRDGPRQVEIRESPYDPEFGYYAMGLGTLTGAYLAQQEVFGEEEGSALYTVALDCQEMHLVAGGLEFTVTGDLSRDGFASLAAQLTQLASTR